MPSSTGFTNVSATNLQDASGQKIANATIYFAPVSNTGAPLSFRVGGTAAGQSMSKPVSTTVINGAFSIELADTAETDPLNIGYKVTVIDNVTGDSILGAGYGCVQPTGTTWNFDDYQPILGNQVTLQVGPAGASVNPRGAWATNTAYAPLDIFTSGGSSYIVNTAYTSSSAFGNIDTNNATVLAAAGQAGASGLSVPDGYTGPYSAGRVYATGEACTFAGQDYTSLASGNQGNTPNTSPRFWQQIAETGYGPGSPTTGTSTATYTTGNASPTVYGPCSQETFILPTPLGQAGALSKVQVTTNSGGAAGAALKVLILTGSGVSTSGGSGSAGGTFTVVDSFQVSTHGSGGVETFLAGTDFSPRNVTAGQYIGFYVPAGGAVPTINTGTSVGFFTNNSASDPGTAPAAYTFYAFDLNLSVDVQVTTTTTVSGNSITASAVASAIAATQVGQAIGSRRTLLLNEPFADSALPPGWTASAGTWTVSGGLITPADVTGFTSVLYLPKYFSLGQRTIRVAVEMLSSGVLGIGTLASAHAVGGNGQNSLVRVDAGAGAITIGNGGFGPGIDPGVLATASIPFALATGHVYQVAITINNRQLTASITDPVSGQVATVTAGDNASDVGACPWGSFADYPAFAGIAGRWKVHSFQILANAVRPRTVFLGDSITYGYNIALADSWAYKEGQESGASYVISGRPGGSSFGVLGRISSEVLPLMPQQVHILIGTNDTSQSTLPQFEANMTSSVALLAAAGIRVFVGLIPPLPGGQSAVNSENAFLQTLTGVKLIRYDLALSTGHDGITQNTSLFTSDQVHPNAAGGTVMALRPYVDAPEMFD